MLGALSSGGVLKMVALADQGTMSGPTKPQRDPSLGWRLGLDGVRLEDDPLLTRLQQG